MIKRLKRNGRVIRKGNLIQWEIGYCSSDGYHRKRIWAEDKEDAENILLHLQGFMNGPLTWEQAFQLYESSRRRQVTERTLHCMELTISHLPFHNKPIGETPITEMGEWLYNKAADTSPQNANKEFGQLITICNFLKNTGRIKENPFTVIKKIKAKPAERKPIPTGRLNDYLSVLDIWTRPIITFLCMTGLRVSEAANLNEADINHNTNTLTVHCKGGQTRNILLDQILSDIINEAKAIKERHNIKSACLFTNSRGNRWQPASLHRKVKSDWLKAGLDPEVTIHSTRHFHATYLVQNGASIENVRKALGHASTWATQRYVHLDEADAFNASSGARSKMIDLLEHQKAAAARKNFSVVSEGA